MDNNERLVKLKKLATLPELDKGFPSQQACIAWSNDVAPLLRFRDEYYEKFVHYAQYINHTGLSSATVEPALNNMISITKQAVIDLESNPPEQNKIPTSSDLPPDSKATMSLKEKIENHPVVFFLTFIVIAFSAGFAASEKLRSTVGSQTSATETQPTTQPHALMEQRAQELIQQHNKITAQLQEQYVEQQKEATSHGNIGSHQEKHRLAAQEIARLIDLENVALTQQLAALRSIDCGNAK